MPRALSSEQLRSLAAHGAKARPLELESEMAAISAAFPDLAGAAEEEMGRTEERSRNFAVTSPPRAHVCRRAKGSFCADEDVLGAETRCQKEMMRTAGVRASSNRRQPA